MLERNIGSKRLVVGAHYGMRDWLIQRVTAVVIAIYTVIVFMIFICAKNISYENWIDIFSYQWFKILTFVTAIAMFYHAWIGIRDIWMDYVQSFILRLVLQIVTILWLLGCTSLVIQILWGRV